MDIKIGNQYKMVNTIVYGSKEEVLGTGAVSLGGVELYGDLIDGTSDTGLFWVYMVTNGFTQGYGDDALFVIPAGSIITILEDSPNTYFISLDENLSVDIMKPFIGKDDLEEYSDSDEYILVEEI